MNDFGAVTSRLKDLLEPYMAEFLSVDTSAYDGAEANTLFEAMRYTSLAPGKRIRPLLLLMACEAVGGAACDALPYACAIEFIHNYSLIHDDLPAMDDDDLRRGAPTNHKVFGEAMAILAGDGLLSAAFEIMHRDYVAHISDLAALKRRIMAGEVIAESCGPRGMVAGQAADIEAEGKGCSAAKLDYIHTNKTAALIRAALCAGAWLGGADEDRVSAFRAYGENLGLAFQIADDLLDAAGDTNVIGKTAGKDLRDGKATYPALHGVPASREKLSLLTERAVEGIRQSGADAQYINYFSKMAHELELRVR